MNNSHQTKILPPTPASIRTAADTLRAGGLVAVPTETVYGLAAHALDEAACRQIFAVKGRPLLDPLIVHILTLAKAQELGQIPDSILPFLQKAWPGPLTIVVPKKSLVPDLITAGRDTVALRVPAHPLMRSLLLECDLPLAAPSANPFGYISPTTAEHVQLSLGGRIQWILDGGPCNIGLESTIIDFSNPSAPKLLRPGGMSREQAEQLLSLEIQDPPVLPQPQSAPPAQGLLAPGMLSRHYSPHTRIQLFSGNPPTEAMQDPDCAILFQSRHNAAAAQCHPHLFWLSEDGSAETAARHLFELLRALDAKSYTTIWAELPAKTGLGHALHDRLLRAAARG